METMLIDKEIAKEFLPKIYEAFRKEGTELRADNQALEFIDVALASESDWDTEYLANILSIKCCEW